LKTVPRQPFDRAVDIAVARDPGAPLALAAGTAPANFGANRLPIVADDFVLTGDQQLVDADIDADDIPGLTLWRFGKLDPDHQRLFGQCTPLNDARPGH